MKKGIIFVIAAVLLGIQVMAQDVIYFNNGSQQKAKVSEVRVDEIVYKKTENLNGPVYTTKKSEIQMIEFSNGYKETFTAVNHNNNNGSNNYTSNTPQSYNNNNYSNNQQPQNNQGGRTTYETNNYYTSNGQTRPNVNVNVGGGYYGGGYGGYGGYYGGGYGGWGGWGWGGYYRPVYYGGWGGGWGGWGGHHGGYGGGGWGGHHGGYGGGHHHR